MNLKSAAQGFAWFLAFMAVHAYVVRPAAQRFNVPLLKDL